MDDPEWAGFLRERSPRVEMPQPKASRRTRGPLAALLLVLATLYAMCWRPAWDGSRSRELSAQEQRDALTMPPRDVSEEKRRAATAAAFKSATDAIRLLADVATEDSPAGRDARTMLGHLRDQLGR